MVDEYFKGRNVFELDLDTVVYKYIPFKYVQSMIREKTFSMRKASDWEDVYENWFLKENFELENGMLGTATNHIPGVYGQSWTKEEESDAMWRIYSMIDNPKNGSKRYLEDVAVRIKSTARKIFDAIYTEDANMATTYIGSVKYLTEEEFRKMQDDIPPISLSDFNQYLYKSYFYKRKPFEHEKEVRAIVILPNNDTNFGTKALCYSINPDDFIEEIVADPRLTKEEYDHVRGSLIAMGVLNNKIRQSKLYHIEPHTIKLI